MAITHKITSRSGKIQTVRLTPRSAILYFCRECLGFETSPNLCTSPNCPLYPFRTRRAFAELAKKSAKRNENEPGINE